MRVVSVGPLARHFVAHWHHVEGNVGEFSVDDELRVRQSRGGWGGIAVYDPNREPPAIPDDAQEASERVRSFIESSEHEASAIVIAYAGRYRELVYEELFPFDGPDAGPLPNRLGSSATVALAANAELTSLVRPPQFLHGGGYGLYCYPPSCRQEPRWVDLPPQARMRLRTARMAHHPTESASVMLIEQLLAAARSPRGVTLDALHARETLSPGQVLPSAIAPAMRWGVTMFARVPDGSAHPQAERALTVPIEAWDLAGGDFQGSVTEPWLGHSYTLRLRAHSGSPTLRAPGRHRDERFSVEYSVSVDGAAPSVQHGSADVTYEVDAERAVLLATRWVQPEGTQHHEPPNMVTLPSPTPPYTAINAYVAVQSYIPMHDEAR